MKTLTIKNEFADVPSWGGFDETEFKCPKCKQPIQRWETRRYFCLGDCIEFKAPSKRRLISVTQALDRLRKATWLRCSGCGNCYLESTVVENEGRCARCHYDTFKKLTPAQVTKMISGAQRG